MKMNKCLIAALFISSVAGAKNPKLPNSEWTVHDKSRPHPVKVTTKGAVVSQAPEDAIVLFDGSDLSQWRGAEWTLKDGAMIANESGSIFTKKAFGDCQLHIEWRVPAGREVNGQKGANSGIFMMGRYEIQVQESHTNVTYADGQAAAIYGQKPPLVNPASPQGEWQSYDIIFRAPRYNSEGMVKPAVLTMLFNGVLVHNAQEILGLTKHKKLPFYPPKHKSKASIRLQWHKDPIEYRNIWIRDLSVPDAVKGEK